MGKTLAKMIVHLPSIQEGGVSEDRLEGVEGLLASDVARSDLPVVGIKFASSGGTTPHNGNEAQRQRDGTDSVVCRSRHQSLAPGVQVSQEAYQCLPGEGAWWLG